MLKFNPMLSSLSLADYDRILLGAYDDLINFKNANILISGGTGYIGKWLIEGISYANKILNLNSKITVISRDPKNFINNSPHLAQIGSINFITSDIRNFNLEKNLKFTHAIHAATDVVKYQNPLETFDVCVSGTRRFLEQSKSADVKKLLILSSGAIYGSIPNSIDKVPEKFEGRPNINNVGSAYGLGKVAAEWLGTAFSDSTSVECKVARVFAQIGPFLPLDKHFAAGNFLLNAKQGSIFTITGNGMPIRTYMYGTDLVVWLLAILQRGRNAAAYNVGSDDGITILELAKKIAHCAGIMRPTFNIQSPKCAGNVQRYVPDISLAKNDLGLSIRVPLKDGILNTLDWMSRAYQ